MNKHVERKKKRNDKRTIYQWFVLFAFLLTPFVSYQIFQYQTNSLASAAPPDQVTGLTATPGIGEVTLNWSAPGDGGSPITDYIIEFRTGFTATYQYLYTTFDDGVSTSTSAVIDGLPNDIEFQFQVAAVNADGQGVFSDDVEATPGISWSLDSVDPLPVALQAGSAVEFGGLIYHFGGQDDNPNAVNTVYIYNPASAAGARWTEDTTDPMPADRSHGVAVVVGSEIYYLLGRDDPNNAPVDTVFIYNPAGADGARWSTGTSATGFGRHSHAAAASGTEIYVFGGFSGAFGPDEDTVQSYDTVGDVWTTGSYATMTSAVSRITAQEISGDIIIGGGSLTELLIYDIGGDSFSSSATLPDFGGPRASCSAVSGGLFYLIGGDSDLVYEYDPVGNSFGTGIPSLSQNRQRCSAVAIGTILYAIGGSDGSPSDSFETYDPGAVIPPAGAPSPPIALRPPNNSNQPVGIVTLGAVYSARDDAGDTNYRVSSSSLADCTAGVNIVATASGTSPDNYDRSYVDITGLTDGNTYYWCAQNDDGSLQSAWTEMGQFTVDARVPSLNYATYIGGTGDDEGWAIHYYNGDIYMAGRTQSSDFPGTTGAYDSTFNGNRDGVVLRFSPDGSGSSDLDWATYIGSSTSTIQDFFTAVRASASGVFVGGNSAGSNYPTTTGAFSETYGGGIRDAVLSQLSLDGSSLLYSTYLGGSGATFDQIEEVFFESSSRVHVTGLTSSADFPTTVGAYDTTIGGLGDGFYSVINPAGGGTSDLIYSTFVGGANSEFAFDLDFDGASAYIVGYAGSGFPTTSGAYRETIATSRSQFLAVIQPSGGGASDLQYATYINNVGSGEAKRVDVDGGLVYITGKSTDDLPTTSGAVIETYGGTSWASEVAFLSVINPAGGGSSDLVYSTYLGPTRDGLGIHASGGVVYVLADLVTSEERVAQTSGQTTTPITDDAADTLQDTGTNGDGVLYRINPQGNGTADVEYATYINSSFVDDIFDLWVDGDNVYVMGHGDENPVAQEFPTRALGGTPFQSGVNDEDDFFFLRFDFSGCCITGGGPTVPSAVNDLSAAPGDTQVVLTWSAPSDGGSTITDYTVEFGATAGFPGNVTTFPDGVNASTGATVTGLTNGTDYSFRITAVNAVGSSSASNVATATPVGGGGGGGGNGGGGGTITQNLGIPTVDEPVVLGVDSIEYPWAYVGTNHAGFRIINEEGQQVVEFTDPSIRRWERTGLDHNTAYDGNKIRAFTFAGEGGLSSAWSTAVTEIIPVAPVLESRIGTEVIVSIDQTPNNLDVEESGIQFELVIPDVQASSDTIITSGWQQSTTYTFTDIPLDADVQVRTKSRNQVGVETPWSQLISISGGEALPAELMIGLSLSTIDGEEVPNPVDPQSILFGTISLQNSSQEDADNVFVNLPLPQYLNFVPGSLQVGGNIQTNSPDQDLGQGTSDTISVVFPEVQSGEIKLITFQLAFDVIGLELLSTQEVIEEQIREEVLEFEDSIQTGELINETVLQAASIIAAANPVLSLQASASASNVVNPVFSNTVNVSPNLAVFTPVPPTPIPPSPLPPAPVLPPSPPTPIAPTPTPSPVPTPTPTPAPPAPTGGGSLENLFLTGTAESADEEIEFTGTTSEPNSTITVVFNDRVTRTLTSDNNGIWRTFVSADELGILEGETAEVEIRGVAQKDDLTSNTVVQNVIVTRAIEGEVVVEIDEAVSEESFLVDLIEEQEEIIETTLVVAAPVILASSLPLWGYLPYLPTLILHLISWLLGLFGKDKKGRLFGVVYDSITKQPLSLAIVRVYDAKTKKLVKTEVTNKEGRYEFLLEPGEYTLEAKKPTYLFPSKIVSGSVDGEYQHVYQVTKGLNVSADELALPDLPLDPQNAKRKFQLSNIFKKLWIGLQAIGHYLALPMLFIGALVSIISVVTAPDNAIYWILAVIYVLMLVLQLIFREHKEKAWGVVYEVTTNAALPLVSLQLIDPEFGKVVKSRLSDYEGRFSFLPEPGKYLIKASKEGYSQPEVVESRKDRDPLQGEVEIQKKDERITGDIPLRQTE